MSNDRKLVFEPPVPSPTPEIPVLKQVLLTGGTGFIGPFLIKSLLEQTQAKIHVLVRASDEKQGRQRLKAAMESMGPCGALLMEMFEARVIPVCGDLGQPMLGLTQDVWDLLAREIDTVFHNGATVTIPRSTTTRCEKPTCWARTRSCGWRSRGDPKSSTMSRPHSCSVGRSNQPCIETDSELEYGTPRFRVQPVEWAAEQVVASNT